MPMSCKPDKRGSGRAHYKRATCAEQDVTRTARAPTVTVSCLDRGKAAIEKGLQLGNPCRAWLGVYIFASSSREANEDFVSLLGPARYRLAHVLVSDQRRCRTSEPQILVTTTPLACQHTMATASTMLAKIRLMDYDPSTSGHSSNTAIRLVRLPAAKSPKPTPLLLRP